MFWERGQTVIQSFSGELFVLHYRFIYYLPHISVLLFLCLIALAFDSHDTVICHLVFILSAPSQSPSSPQGTPICPPHSRAAPLPPSSGSYSVTSNWTRWENG